MISFTTVLDKNSFVRLIISGNVWQKSALDRRHESNASIVFLLDSAIKVSTHVEACCDATIPKCIAMFVDQPDFWESVFFRSLFRVIMLQFI